MNNSPDVIRPIIKDPICQSIKVIFLSIQEDGEIKDSVIIEIHKIKSALKLWDYPEINSVNSDLMTSTKNHDVDGIIECLTKLEFFLSRKSSDTHIEKKDIWEYTDDFNRALTKKERNQEFSNVWKELPSAVSQWVDNRNINSFSIISKEEEAGPSVAKILAFLLRFIELSKCIYLI